VTLLESVIACVLLALVGVVCLEQVSEAARLQQRTAAWSEAIPAADQALAAALLNAPAPEVASPDGTPRAAGARVAASSERRPWRAGVDLIEVTVPVASGGHLTVSHLVAAPRPRTP